MFCWNCSGKSKQKLPANPPFLVAGRGVLAGRGVRFEQLVRLGVLGVNGKGGLTRQPLPKAGKGRYLAAI